MKGFIIVGTRPNFMKAAALYKPLSEFFDIRLVHTDQHYDDAMSKVFFEEFNHLDIYHHFDLFSKGGAKQTAEIMDNFNILCKIDPPDFVIVVGDVNSTLACGLVSKKRGIPLIHVEAGLRSFDQTMPEEVNRRLVDHISDIMFATEPVAMENLCNENVQGKYYLVGDVMIDTVVKFLLPRLKEVDGEYCICTIHRQKNVRDKEILRSLLEMLQEINAVSRVIFPVHPHTGKMIFKYGYERLLKNLDIKAPMPYVDFLSYANGADFVITDSGGLQTECNYLNIPCLVLRENTERENAVYSGCCELVGFDHDLLMECIDKIYNGNWKDNSVLDIDDGNASERITNILNGCLL